MDTSTLQEQLSGLPIPQVRYFHVIGSTNDEALTWASDGAQNGCLVVADQQTQGRGRMGRRWVTHPGAALAFSIILRPSPAEQAQLGFFSPLGALAICQALERLVNLSPQIKWPNDVLIQGKKAAGILVEAAWLGEQLQGIVIGIGINITAEAVPPENQLMYPAVSVEEASGQSIDRWIFLKTILEALFDWRERLHSPDFFDAWEQRLAFMGEWVRIDQATGQPDSHSIEGQVIGLDPGGNLRLQTASGAIETIVVGDVHLRLMHS